ncbi:MAG: APC family permease [Planctomycetaceae bacterium]|nr:APC family permease [Planctomycetaceae bacterium]
MNNRNLVKDIFVGKAKDLYDKKVFHNISLIALLAWVGLGADGLSSSCYGPEESFRSLGQHSVLSLFVGLACMITIMVLCASYSQIIELFPGGGGGYLVASKLLSPTFGAISGCALLIDYVLTIALSISSGTDALFSILPPHWLSVKVPFAVAITMIMIVVNLRGVKESVTFCMPVFFTFLATYLFTILYTIATHVGSVPLIVNQVGTDLRTAHSQIGSWGIFMLLIRSYSVGAGTYTGIEAVSNGLPLLREPKVATGRRTMVYMAVSLVFVVGGLFLSYLLYNVGLESGKTLNASLVEKMTANWPNGLGQGFVWVTMISSMALLCIAAQTGFLDGPRIMSNMAVDRWFPSRFSILSSRLVTQNGVMIMGISAIVLILATRGRVGFLVVLYSINVFITFTLSQLGMIKHWWNDRKTERKWFYKLSINGVGFCLTLFILVLLSIVKFWDGGWVTLVATGLLVAFAFAVRGHYRGVMLKLTRLRKLAEQFESNSQSKPEPQAVVCDNTAKTAVIFVSGFNGLGVHTLLSINRMFEGSFKNYVFINAGVVDAGNFKGSGEIEKLKEFIDNESKRYVDCMKRLGYYSEFLTDIGTDVVETTSELADKTASKFPNSVFFGGQLVFDHESIVTRLLHNHTVFALQRKLFRQGQTFVVLPIRV